MSNVIYADVLVVLNIYVTCALLSLAGIICRRRRFALRLVAASFIAGFYSLIILVPQLNEIIALITRIPVSIVICLIAFGLSSKKAFIRLWLTFIGVSFAFAGVMLFLWLFFAPRGMYYNNGIVYFNIDTATLVVLTVICYILLSVCRRLISTRVPQDTVYECELFYEERSVRCHCFLDTGNCLSDPYTGAPVMIITKEKYTLLVPDSSQTGTRFIVCNGISGSRLLDSFRCDKIIIKGLQRNFQREDVIIAVTEQRLRGGHFDGILPPQFFENHTKETMLYR